MKKLAIGIDIGGINTAFGLVDENGDLYADSVVSTKKFPLFTDYPAYVAELTESLHALADSLSFEYELVGIGIGYVVMLIPESPSMLVIGVSVGAVYVLAMLALFQQGGNRFSFLSFGASKAKDAEGKAAAVSCAAGCGAACPRQQIASADEARGDESASEPDGDVLEQIASYYGLPRREAEVLPYLARGRSAKVIAEALFVSESTVRTHTRRILEKTALHSKQDLIDLIEKYE